MPGRNTVDEINIWRFMRMSVEREQRAVRGVEITEMA